jgi:hypothetical protein
MEVFAPARAELDRTPGQLGHYNDHTTRANPMSDGRNSQRIENLERAVQNLRKTIERLEQSRAEAEPKPPSISQDGYRVKKTRSRGKTVEKLLKYIGIAAGIVIAGVTCVQWHDLRKNFAIDEHAWVKINYDWPDLDKPDSLTSIKMTFTNIGKSPITRFDGDGVAQVRLVDAPPSLTLKVPYRTIYSNVIAPNEPLEWRIDFGDLRDHRSLPLTQEEIEGLKQGKLYLAVYGMVEYDDQFGPHWYRFCSYTTYPKATIAVRGGECVQHNSIGDGHASLNY